MVAHSPPFFVEDAERPDDDGGSLAEGDGSPAEIVMLAEGTGLGSGGISGDGADGGVVPAGTERDAGRPLPSSEGTAPGEAPGRRRAVRPPEMPVKPEAPSRRRFGRRDGPDVPGEPGVPGESAPGSAGLPNGSATCPWPGTWVCPESGARKT